MISKHSCPYPSGNIWSDGLRAQQLNHAGFLGWRVVRTSLQGTDSNSSNAWHTCRHCICGQDSWNDCNPKKRPTVRKRIFLCSYATDSWCRKITFSNPLTRKTSVTNCFSIISKNNFKFKWDNSERNYQTLVSIWGFELRFTNKTACGSTKCGYKTKVMIVSL